MSQANRQRSKPKDVFQIIAAAQDAMLREQAANAAHNALKERLPYNGAFVPTLEWNEFQFRFPSDIRRHINQHITEAETSLGPIARRALLKVRPKLRQFFERLYEAEEVKLRELHKKAGYRATCTEWSIALHGECTAFRRVACAKPRTADELKALVEFLNSLSAEDLASVRAYGDVFQVIQDTAERIYSRCDSDAAPKRKRQRRTTTKPALRKAA